MTKFEVFLKKKKLFYIHKDQVRCKKSENSDARISRKMNPQVQMGERMDDADSIGLLT